MSKTTKHTDMVYRVLDAPLSSIASMLEGGGLGFGLVTVKADHLPFFGQTGYYDDNSWEPDDPELFAEIQDDINTTMEDYLNDEDYDDLGRDWAVVYFNRPFVDDYELVLAADLRPATPEEALAYALKVGSNFYARELELLEWGERWRLIALMGMGSLNSDQLAQMPSHNPPGYQGRNADD
jgi:hypothetical protein